MNILYVHGFGSQFDETSNKIQSLKDLGTVFGVNIDYTRSKHELFEELCLVAIELGIDLLVGTSMGGYMAAAVGDKLGIPFVAINPAIKPDEPLKKYLGTHKTYYGEPYTLSEETTCTFGSIETTGCGLILLDKGDDVIPYQDTKQLLEKHYSVKVFEGGSHRFEHMSESISLIDDFYFQAGLVYGLDNDD